MMMHKFKTSRLLMCVIAVAAGVTATASANDKYQVSGGQVVVVCPLTVGGSFEATTDKVSGEVAVDSRQPGPVDGAIVVDLRSLETGIGMRDRHMRDNYLEVGKGPEFERARLEGIKVEKLNGKSPFSGTLVLHGERREVTGAAEVQPQNGGAYRIQAEFPVRVTDFKIAKPTYLGVGVQEEVKVKIALTAVPAAVGTSGTRR
jgi:polyisoprenoid-binding protein YceI